MPFYLKEIDVLPEATKYRSVLIVLCRFCPAASVAVRKKAPYIEFFQHSVNTRSFEQLIRDMQISLKQLGVKADVFRGNLFPMPLNFIICMWTTEQRKKLLEQAGKYEAVIVMGCETSYKSIKELLSELNCRVLQGMESEGVFDVVPKFKLPLNISLELNRVVPVTYEEKEEQS